MTPDPTSPANFALIIQEQVDRLKSRTYREIGEATTRKRLAWLNEHFAPRENLKLITPRKAFEILFFDYMGLAPSDLVVVKESDQEIVWLSQNPCPTLEACQVLDLDTRLVCQQAYEQSTQAFIAYLNPQLRFGRSYEDIRPYAPYCKERISYSSRV